VPNPTNPQTLNRFTYVGNNPIRYNDPSGHAGCETGKRCLNPKVTASGAKKNMPASTYKNYIGAEPDYRGIYFATQHVSTNNAIVAAGFAVQSQWFNETWDNPNNSLSSSYGMAQATTEELGGRDPMDPEVAEQIITERIDGAVSNCIRVKRCQDDTDNFIAAGIAQNGVYPVGWFHAASLPKTGLNDPSADWFIVMNKQGEVTNNLFNPFPYDRQNLSGMNFSTKFMLNLFAMDVKTLMELGYSLPENYDDVNWATIDYLLK